ncbi:MAG: isoprenyl transferase [bacterium]
MERLKDGKMERGSSQSLPPSISPSNIPQHIAIIMDGNGRWAQGKGLPRAAGHKEGVESIRVVLKACTELGVKYLTLYAFSTENWRRPETEISFLFNLAGDVIDREVEELNKNGVKINFLGRIAQLPKHLQKKVAWAMEKTANNKRITLNIMTNYGSRAELVDAFRAMMNDQLTNDEINEKTISNYLYTKGMPDPDLLIRTAGEMRVSNYLLWQIAYAEIYVTELCFPEFRKEQLKVAVLDYQKRTRKFGKTKEQIKDAA